MTDRTISPPGSPLRRRMTEDMTVRGFTPKKKRKAETAAFMEVAEAPFDLLCS